MFLHRSFCPLLCNREVPSGHWPLSATSRVSILARVSRTFLELPSKDLTLWSVYFGILLWLHRGLRGEGQRRGEESKFSVNSIGCYCFAWKLLSTDITNTVGHTTWIFPLSLHLARECGSIWVILEAQTIWKKSRNLRKTLFCFSCD